MPILTLWFFLSLGLPCFWNHVHISANVWARPELIQCTMAPYYAQALISLEWCMFVQHRGEFFIMLPNNWITINVMKRFYHLKIWKSPSKWLNINVPKMPKFKLVAFVSRLFQIQLACNNTRIRDKIAYVHLFYRDDYYHVLLYAPGYGPFYELVR